MSLKEDIKAIEDCIVQGNRKDKGPLSMPGVCDVVSVVRVLKALDELMYGPFKCSTDGCVSRCNAAPDFCPRCLVDCPYYVGGMGEGK